jgi:hypothetical protein
MATPEISFINQDVRLLQEVLGQDCGALINLLREYCVARVVQTSRTNASKGVNGLEVKSKDVDAID